MAGKRKPEKDGISKELSRADAHLRKGRIEQAERIYRSILARRPGDPRAHHGLGRFHHLQGQPMRGLAHLRSALEANPREPRYWLDYGEALLAAGAPADTLQLIELARGSVALDGGEPRELAQRADHARHQLDLLLALYQREAIPEALQAASRFTESWPAAAIGWSVLAACHGRRGEAAPAAEAARRAVHLNPDDPNAQANLAAALLELGELEPAEAACRSAIRSQPDHAVSHNNLGNVLARKRLPAEAVSCYREALNHAPDYAEAHLNLALTLIEMERPEEAEAQLRRSLATIPNAAGLHNTLGIVLKRRGDPHGALRSFTHAATLDPELATAHNNLGVLKLDRLEFDQAEPHLRRALQLDPDHPNTIKNLGLSLHYQLRLEEAEACYRRALELDPAYAAGYRALGVLLWDQGRGGEAIAAYRRALEIEPDDWECWSNLLFCLDGASALTPEQRYREALRFGASVRRHAQPYTSWNGSFDPERRLRVGWVSGDLRDHPVSHFLETVLKALPRDRLTLIAYPTTPCRDRITDRLRGEFDLWRDSHGLPDPLLSQRIHDDGIDILIDLSGHTAHNRLPLFAWRPAPLQLSWIGYSATTGLEEIDYYLTDEVRVPPEMQRHYTETVCYLPDTRLCFSPPEEAPPVTPLPALTRGEVTFGCFQNLAKVGAPVVAAWASILAALPASRLRLQSRQLADRVERERLLRRLTDAGIDPGRVELHRATDREGYLNAHGEVDLILDTFPYPGGTTTCEALWMGVPTLTLAGESETSRNGASQLSCAGLGDWVAHDEAEYVHKAVAFAGDPRRLAGLRAGLREQVGRSPLFDAPRFATRFAATLGELWRRRCRGE